MGERSLLTQTRKNEFRYSTQRSEGKIGSDTLPTSFPDEILWIMGKTRSRWTKGNSSERCECAIAVTPLGSSAIQQWKCFPSPTAANRVKLGPQFKDELMRVWQKACLLYYVLQQVLTAVQLPNKELFSLATYIITGLS